MLHYAVQVRVLNQISQIHQTDASSEGVEFTINE